MLVITGAGGGECAQCNVESIAATIFLRMQVSVLGAQLEVQGSVVLVTISRLRMPIIWQ